jgi:hypothetical protein
MQAMSLEWVQACGDFLRGQGSTYLLLLWGKSESEVNGILFAIGTTFAAIITRFVAMGMFQHGVTPY